LKSDLIIIIIIIILIKSPPRTPTSEKRILSRSSSNSPLHEEKKTKTFTSPNRFAVLASIDTNDDSVFDAVPPSHEVTAVPSSLASDQVEPLVPPIYIRNINNFSAFKDILERPSAPRGLYVSPLLHTLSSIPMVAKISMYWQII